MIALHYRDPLQLNAITGRERVAIKCNVTIEGNVPETTLTGWRGITSKWFDPAART